MGLDGVEMIMHIEEAFGITIFDEEAGKMRTVEDLCRCVIGRLERLPANACLSSFAFYRLRRALIARLGVARHIVRPSTPMDTLLPAKGRRRAWREIIDILGLKVPGLVKPSIIDDARDFLNTSVLESGLGMALYYEDLSRLENAFFSGIVLAHLINILTAPMAVRLPPDCETVGSTVKTILRENYGRLAEMRNGWTESEVRNVIKAIIVEDLGVWPDVVKPESRFDEDLDAC